MERSVKFSDFRDDMNLSRIGVVTVHAEHEAPHHGPEPTSGRELVRRVEAQEMAEVDALHLWAAKHTEDQVTVHCSIRLFTPSIR